MKRRFERLVDEHGGRLLQLAGLMLRSQAEAEDVVQDCLVKLWHQLPRLIANEELPWLITCTRNACLDRLRTDRRRGQLLQGFAQALEPANPSPVPEQHHISSRRADELHAAIATLPEPGRSLLILRDIQELDVGCVARALSLSENQVKVYTFRARRALRQTLEASHQLEEAYHEQFA
jgi:RNA polymerase sigma-70 factor, ECF subfamily